MDVQKMIEEAMAEEETSPALASDREPEESDTQGEIEK